MTSAEDIKKLKPGDDEPAVQKDAPKKIIPGPGPDGGLVADDVISEPEELKAMGSLFRLPVWNELPYENMNLDFTRKVTIQFLKKFKMIPLETSEGTYIAVRNPSYFQIIDDLKNMIESRVNGIVLAPEASILSAINYAYDHSRDTAEEFIQTMDGESTDSIISEIEETGDLLDDTSDAPMIKLVNLMLSQAVKDRASDIHIEPYQNSVKVRYRIDGVLYNILNLPRKVQSSLVSRIKIMAKLNIAEKRLPQDGRIDIKIADRSVDIRVSSIPTAFGERVVLRLLDKTGSVLNLSDLGMDEKRIKLFNDLIKSPYGIILVTGPTGSGKTTTLYSALSSINNPDINIITIEDPIEYQIEGIGQIQINPKIDLTFANGLRSIVRQDPDVILVGEIRDRETAEIAIQSSLTGHLVFSTLHTNDAAGSITRLIEMGIEPFLVVSSVIAIVAQRLVRVLCPKCKMPYTPDDESLGNMGFDRKILEKHVFYKKKGCVSCMHTGYKGRSAIFEILLLDDEIKKLILRTSDANQINELALRRGMTNLLNDGARKALEGVTTVEEVLRVTRVLKRGTDISLTLDE